MTEGISHFHLGLFTYSAGYAPKDKDMKSTFSCPEHISVFQNKTSTLESDHRPTSLLKTSQFKVKFHPNPPTLNSPQIGG